MSLEPCEVRECGVISEKVHRRVFEIISIEGKNTRCKVGDMNLREDQKMGVVSNEHKTL